MGPYRLPCFVVEKTGKKHIFHRLRCVHGVLKSCYQESDLELHHSGISSSNDSLKVEGLKDEKLITLCEASNRQNPCNKFYGDNCSCQKGCSSRRCGCVIKGKPCSIAIAMEGGHAKMKQSILLLEAHQATAQMEKEKMKQSILLLGAHQATVQIENIVHAKRAAHPGIVVVS